MRHSPVVRWMSLLPAVILSLASCAPPATPAIFIPPTQASVIPIPTQIPHATSAATAFPSPTPTVVVTPTPCTNGLTYIQDLTIPDNTVVSAGQSIDKQWLVSNSGSCDWDSTYQLRLINGSPMGVAGTLPLYPARAGAQATLEITFTAPSDPGTYRSAWQAFSPEGQAFGDAIYIQIIVQ